MLQAAEGARPLNVTVPIRVQTYDIDAAGHVNNGVYVRWLEDLRMEVLRQYYPLKAFTDAGLMPILANTNIAYKRSILLHDEPVGHMWCTKLGRATLTLEAEIVVEDQLCAHATQRGILLNIGTTKPARVPKELIAQFEKTNVAG
jgi:YbgC/YbaW family acyl-CoA thioester hydrolase